MKIIISTAIVSIMLLSSGCASITQSEMQGLALSSTYQGKPVESDCKLTNDRGSWDAKAPNMVNIRKSGEDLNVICKKDGIPDGLLKAVSRAAGSMFGNIILGGGIGAMIDHSNGKGYSYPDQLPVKMGETVIIDKRESAVQAELPKR